MEWTLKLKFALFVMSWGETLQFQVSKLYWVSYIIQGKPRKCLMWVLYTNHEGWGSVDCTAKQVLGWAIRIAYIEICAGMEMQGEINNNPWNSDNLQVSIPYYWFYTFVV